MGRRNHKGRTNKKIGGLSMTNEELKTELMKELKEKKYKLSECDNVYDTLYYISQVELIKKFLDRLED